MVVSGEVTLCKTKWGESMGTKRYTIVEVKIFSHGWPVYKQFTKAISQTKNF